MVNKETKTFFKNKFAALQKGLSRSNLDYAYLFFLKSNIAFFPNCRNPKGLILDRETDGSEREKH